MTERQRWQNEGALAGKAIVTEVSEILGINQETEAIVTAACIPSIRVVATYQEFSF